MGWLLANPAYMYIHACIYVHVRILETNLWFKLDARISGLARDFWTKLVVSRMCCLKVGCVAERLTLISTFEKVARGDEWPEVPAAKERNLHCSEADLNYFRFDIFVIFSSIRLVLTGYPNHLSHESTWSLGHCNEKRIHCRKMFLFLFFTYSSVCMNQF